MLDIVETSVEVSVDIEAFEIVDYIPKKILLEISQVSGMSSEELVDKIENKYSLDANKKLNDNKLEVAVKSNFIKDASTTFPVCPIPVTILCKSVSPICEHVEETLVVA